MNIEQIEGIGPRYAEKLATVGIKTTGALIEAANTSIKRKELAEQTGIAEKLILEWVLRADLFRIKGIGNGYANLLAEAGVETVGELAMRKADNLHNKMKDVNDKNKFVERLPLLGMVEDWISQAKALARKITF